MLPFLETLAPFESLGLACFCLEIFDSGRLCIGRLMRLPHLSTLICRADPTFMNMRHFLPEAQGNDASLEGQIKRDNREASSLLGSLQGQSRKQMRVEVQASAPSRTAGAISPPSRRPHTTIPSMQAPRYLV